MKDMVCVGAIGGAFGVRGELRLKSFCAEPEAIGDYGPVTLDNGTTATLKITRAIKGGFSARLDGVVSKEAADALRGQRIHVARARLPDLGDDEFYHADLIGLRVFDTGGVEVGRIRAIHDHGAGDVVDIGGSNGAKSLTLPFTREVFPTVDLAGGRVIVDLQTLDENDGGA